MSRICQPGPFPFAIIDSSAVMPVPGGGVEIDSLTLFSLSKLWWLSKSFDWSASLSYVLMYPASPITDPNIVDTGTATGGETVDTSAILTDGFTSYPLNPDQRTSIFWPNPDTGTTAPSGVTANQGMTNSGSIVSGSGTNPYSNGGGMAFVWFVLHAYGSAYFTGIYAKSASQFATTCSFRVGIGASSGIGQNYLTPDSTAAGAILMGSTLTIKVPNESDVVKNLYFIKGGASGPDPLSVVCSGNIVFDFNSFWSP